jgi:hypothetical protein
MLPGTDRLFQARPEPTVMSCPARRPAAAARPRVGSVVQSQAERAGAAARHRRTIAEKNPRPK